MRSFEPTMVVMIDDMSDVVGAGTPGPVENTTIGVEEFNLMGLDVSVPTIGEGVTGEDDEHHGEVEDTHTERLSVCVSYDEWLSARVTRHRLTNFHHRIRCLPRLNFGLLPQLACFVSEYQ